MFQIRTLAATLALGASVLGGNAWGALCDNSSMSLGGFTGSCQELTGGATASFPTGRTSFDVPTAGTQWSLLVSRGTDGDNDAFEFDRSWSTVFPTSSLVSADWSLTGSNGSADAPLDILAFVLLDVGTGQPRDAYLSFYIKGPTWDAAVSRLAGEVSLLDGNNELSWTGVFIYGSQRATDPGTGGRAPEPASIALLGALGLGFLGARRLGRLD